MQVLAIGMLVLGAQAQRAEGPEADFDRGLAAVQEQIREGDWEEARTALTQLLEEHAEEGTAWLRRPRIVEAARLCAFLPGYEVPRPRDLVAGELASYSPSTGQMRLVYEDGELGDFNVRRASGEFEFGVQGELGAEDYLLHPVLFQRGYSIKVRGARYAGRFGREVVPTVYCALSPWDGQLVCFGLPGTPETGLPAFIGSGEGELLDQDPSPAEIGQPYEFEVRVKKGEVLGLWNGRRVLRAKKKRKLFGQVGVGGIPDWEAIEIAGVAQRSWMRGLQDEAFHVAYLEFAESFDEDAAVPAWLRFEDDEWSMSWADRIRANTPEEHAAEIEKFFELMPESFEEATSYLLEDSGLLVENPALLMYLFAALAWGSEDWEEAATFCREALTADPDFVAARDLDAWVLGRLEGPDAARARFAELCAEDPGNVGLRGGHAVHAFLAGKREDAWSVVRRAVDDGVYGTMVDAVSEALGKADSGPFWRESFVHETEHYRIASDIDLRTCIEAGDILETALGYYEKRYLPLPKEDVEPFRVYIFSGQIGYQLYLVNTILSPVENSAGVYLPGMEQLLIWNTPDREDMLATVRHEGLHQYVDRFMDEHPSWLGEGLGEYWEEADFTKGRSRQNAPTEEKLALLRSHQQEFLPLHELLRVPSADFYAEDAGRNYVQSWAFVHFLQHGGREYRALFDRLFTALAAGTPSEEAVEAVFGEVDPDELDRAFAKYVGKLGRS